jgi:endonuclease-3
VPTAESTQKDVKRKLTRCVRILEEKYGPHIYPEDCQNPLDQIVFAILAARNPVTNARKAVRDFKDDYVDWNEVRVSTIRQLEDTLEKSRIEPTARYAELVKTLLEKTFDEVCRVSLDTLRTDGPEKARKTVSKLDVLEAHEQQYLLVGAGVEEAPPLDPATDRIGLRLGLFAPEDAPPKRRRLLEQHVAAQDALRFHHLMVEHGKKLCTEEAPKCAKCPVQGECDYFRAAETRRKTEEKDRAKGGAKKAAAPEKKPAAAKLELARKRERVGDEARPEAGLTKPKAKAEAKPKAKAEAKAESKAKGVKKPAKAAKRGRTDEDE